MQHHWPHGSIGPKCCYLFTKMAELLKPKLYYKLQVINHIYTRFLVPTVLLLSSWPFVNQALYIPKQIVQLIWKLLDWSEACRESRVHADLGFQCVVSPALLPALLSSYCWCAWPLTIESHLMDATNPLFHGLSNQLLLLPSPKEVHAREYVHPLPWGHTVFSNSMSRNFVFHLLKLR